MANYSFTEENYIKAIYHLQSAKTAATTNELAKILQTRAASVTDMLKKLKQKKLVKYKPYYGCMLTREGEKLALLIVRRHRLWEYFLSEKLGFLGHEVHDIAEELEHVGSPALIDKLDAFLGHPRMDPHGDPIPDTDGTIATVTRRYLAELEKGQSAIITHIKLQSPTMLKMLQQKKLTIGTPVKVVQQFEFDNSMEIVAGKKTVHITKEVAENIVIKIYE